MIFLVGAIPDRFEFDNKYTGCVPEKFAELSEL